jgi:hypothetical protein
MDKPTIIFFERGVAGWATIWGGYKQNWPNLAVTWIHKYAAANNLNWRAQALTYLCLPFTAALTRKRRAKALAALIRAYSVNDWEIIVVAHSEGTATVCAALRLAGYPKVKLLHLVCGAVTADFRQNGMNLALLTGKIEKVVCWRADKDRAMRLEDTVLGLSMFGIDWDDMPLGLSGPVQVALGLKQDRVTENHWPNYGHSSCFLPKNFDITLKGFLP